MHSGEPRKLIETVGGLPNPDLQTSDAALTLRFEDRAGRPEITFEFV